ncbi:efflux RND transporter periplasmic adaptor subunit [Proteiniborus sp. MB09-C3]|uniref:efflux RND transporter periplasmic adaptor subunit n=1 Tax=Proteiniborus sp. MB09-C3 TaxID=3050072 RepID=UPI002556B4B3|nr:efflux RND transporter periplasmic adaptor subunit [Proteiniborus sp. MB09-C3]WIV11995.1 efflux RND transporter periplasmic adaptor subunit [Proteiniborus sp. MB09-C3]
MAKNKKKVIWIAAAVIVGIAIISAGVLKALNTEKGASTYVSVVEVEVENDFDSTLITEGILKSKEQRNVVSNLPYMIQEVLFKEGDKVSEGDVLLKLDVKDLESKIKTAELSLEMERQRLKNLERQLDESSSTMELEKSLENAKLAYENAQTKYEGSKTLHDAGAISKAVLDADEANMITAKNSYELAQKRIEDSENKEDLKSNIDIQRKNVEIQEITLQSQKESLGESIIKSPISGTIVGLNARAGIPATAATPLFVIEDTNSLEIEVGIGEYDISEIQLGQKVKVTGEAFKEKEISGVVSFIAPSATIVPTGTGKEIQVTVKIDIPNADDYLKPGFTANVAINTAHKKEALVLPYETMYEKKDGTKVVFKVEDNKIKEVPVTIGIQGDLKQEVISPDIKQGDKIVANPNEKLHDGLEVSISNSTGEQK